MENNTLKENLPYPGGAERQIMLTMKLGINKLVTTLYRIEIKGA
jgi:hypothetical protein